MPDSAVLMAAYTHSVRDQLRRQVLPFVQSCEHDIVSLPVVDFRLDFTCRKCHGFQSFLSFVLIGVNQGQFWSLDGAGQLALLQEVAGGT